MHLMKDKLQKKKAVSVVVLEKGTVLGAVDLAILHDGEKTRAFTFDNIEKIALCTFFLSNISVILWYCALTTGIYWAL
ncbi:hypothetical protein [Bartonella raoultii]|uniref:Uncharacterized protein n=1 Tax=Bartonella raoultii TaxID=1457020 RepID=A0ABS7I3E4_9HYPH|nr:hypothetical protein [Bartonella raoultii]MBX4335189.1 hypothetical protein [Bartonella raoultii]